MAQSQSKRVALLTKYMAWGGGLEFLRYLLNGLLSVNQQNGLDIFLVVDEEFQATDLYNNFIDLFSQPQSVAQNILVYDGSLPDLQIKLQAAEVDLVFPVNADLGADFAVAWLSYIPDFQHKYLYQNFSAKECFIREVAFSARLRDSRAILVNSQAVKNDIIRFYPWIDQDSIFALPFAPNASTEYLKERPELLAALPDLPQRYFIISNQFWIHKNHAMAFRAFAALAADSEVCLVCTGLMEDYRNANYLHELQALIAELGITERIKLLGHIPKRQQIELMKRAIAVVQPTSFEGGPGGGAVYDAVSLGVPVVLSDIEINTEVIGQHIYFFQLTDESSLTAQMQHLLSLEHQLQGEQDLLLQGRHNLQKLGHSLQQAIDYTLRVYQQ